MKECLLIGLSYFMSKASFVHHCVEFIAFNLDIFFFIQRFLQIIYETMHCEELHRPNVLWILKEWSPKLIINICEIPTSNFLELSTWIKKIRTLHNYTSLFISNLYLLRKEARYAKHDLREEGRWLKFSFRTSIICLFPHLNPTNQLIPHMTTIT
jgi:hypothetical protein